MHHDKYVGHFDPHDPVNTGVQIHKPKVMRALDYDVGLRLLGSFLLDLMLPDAGGVVVLRSVRRRNLPIRIALLTGAGPQSDVLAEARCWNPDAVFHKPMIWADVERWLGLPRQASA
jgi:DNA-binding response OmpR family regulator